MRASKRRATCLVMAALLAFLAGGCGGCSKPGPPGPLPTLAVDLAFAQGGTTLVSFDTDKALRRRDLSKGEEQEIASGMEVDVLCVALAPDGRTAATGHNGGAVKVWDVAGRREKGTLAGHATGVRGLAFAADGKSLAALTWIQPGSGCQIKVWDVAARKDRATIRCPGEASCLAFSPDGKTLAAGTFDMARGPLGACEVQFWDAQTGKEQGRQAGTAKGTTAGTTAVAYSPNGKRLALGNSNGDIKVGDVGGKRWVTLPKGHTTTVRCLAFSPDGTALASGSEDKTARLWDLSGQKERAVLQGHTRLVRALAFAPPGTKWTLGPEKPAIAPRQGPTLATASLDRVVKVWDVATGADLTGAE